MEKRKFEELYIGQSVSLRQTATDEYVVKMAELTGDINPVHLDDEYAKASMFGQRIAHGLFCDGMVSCMLGTDLPGPGSIYLEKHIQFRAPVFLGDEIEGTLCITEINEEKRRVNLSFECTKTDGTIVARGEVLMKMQT